MLKLRIYEYNKLKSAIVVQLTLSFDCERELREDHKKIFCETGISYAKLGNLPRILGLYSSFIPPLVYALMGNSRDLAVETVAVGSLLMASMLGNEVNATENPKLYLHLAFTVTFFTGLFDVVLGFFRYAHKF
ncbi:Sulfate transporter 3.2 [Capsicum baccatum]|uniref:Sulfate transporter 3.2 n=1 Tax=Capsicum baccatum TaxID=33114 RepID=A0A2G2WP75_CAPBA|nr:Sulfate transporter 3.2 [Capsicum baccatum]